jgi:tetratricopeptide (TPR) repeat protein
LDKAVEIKRRAQRCVQNGDLDGALSEYEKLVAADDTDPYNFVLLADLLFKKGDQAGAADRYLSAAAAYEKAGLYKNGIAVCKKMIRLSLSPARVLKQLAVLHAADGLGTEAALYFMQYAEHQVRAEQYAEAADALRKAFDASPDNAKALERLSEVLLLDDDRPGAARALADAAKFYAKTGQLQAAEQCRKRGRQFDEKAFEAAVESAPEPRAAAAPQALNGAPEPGMQDFERLPVPSRPPQLDGDDAPEPKPPAESGVQTIQAAWNGEPAVDPPGLAFESPASRAGAAKPNRLAEVEKLLAEAQDAFKAGDRVRAGAALGHAADAYEAAGSLDQAATIYRSLAKSAQAPAAVMERWLDNCRKREDRSEAAHVACELGDRALAANLNGEAQRWFEQALVYEPENDLAQRRLQRLTGRSGVVPEAEPVAAPAASAAPPETESLEGPDAPERSDAEEETDDDDFLAPDPPRAASGTNGRESGRVELAVGRGEAVTFDLGSLISEFQRGVEAQLSGDAQSHYDLAMAYREMGLLEQAVESFRIASREPAFGDRCTEMIGRCLLDQGRFEDAASEFRVALQSGHLDMETEVNLRYQLGLAHEAAGRIPEALTEFEGVYAAQPNYPDVALKIRVLRKSLESN